MAGIEKLADRATTTALHQLCLKKEYVLLKMH
jgi:hypothetical protein